MAERTINRHKTKTTAKTIQKEDITSRGYSYVDDNTLNDDDELTPEDYNDEAPDTADDRSEYDDENAEDIHVRRRSSIRSLWVLYEGRIIWAASHYGFNIAEKEYLRSRLQLLLEFLHGEFPGVSWEK